MKVPGVTALVGGVAGGAVQMLQAGVQGVTTAADAVQTLTGPVLDSVSQSTARLLGTGRPTNGNRDAASAQRRPWLYDEMGRKRSPPLVDERTCYEGGQPCEEPAPGACGCADPSDADLIMCSR